MKKEVLQDAERYAKAHKRKKRWHKVVTCLAAVVVFCTTYALILPAITLEMQGVSALTEEEQAQVNGVIALIDALPASEEIEESSAAFDEAGDEDALEAYLAEVYPQVQNAYKAYAALTDKQQAKVTNADKLMELEYIWGSATFASEGSIGETLDGDYAYISDLSIVRMVDGATPFDDDDAAGNDSSGFNQIVRSFDMLSYTLNFSSKVRDGAPSQYYKEGRLYFEFVLPVSEEKAVFEPEKMTWLKAKPEATYTITTGTWQGKDAQILRGSFLWRSSSTANQTAIGASFVELDVYLRVLAMTQGDTLEPGFTFWLEGNQVPEGIVTGSDYSCLEHAVTEYKTVRSAAVTVSSAPRYNILLVNGGVQNLGEFDFSTGNEKAFSKDAGSVKGRRSNYGIILQMYGKSADHGLRGCEIPDGQDITFDLDISSSYTYSDAGGSHTIDSADKGYAPLIWSFDENSWTDGGNQQDGRNITGAGGALNAPGNKNADYNSCHNGGGWSGTLSADGKTIHVTVSGYEVDLNKLPYGIGYSTSAQWTYYNPNTITGYWDVQQACFSAGELWIVQPFNRIDPETGNKKNIADEFASGSFTLSLTDKNLKMSGQSASLPESAANENQMNQSDDLCDIPVALEIPGSIDYDLAFRKYNSAYWDDALAEGCWGNGKDWVVAGGEMAIFDYMEHHGEGDSVGVAYDQLVKFDPDYFTLDPDALPQDVEWYDGMTIKVGYGAVGSGSGKGSPESGWNHDEKSAGDTGYDTAMITATADDLIFYPTLSELEQQGYRCVGVLFEFRGYCVTNNFHTDREVKGYATSDQNLAGNVFMVTHSASVWTVRDVKAKVEDYARQVHGRAEPNEEDYWQYANWVFPSRLSEANKGRQINYRTYNASYTSHIEPTYTEESCYDAYPNNYNNQGVNGTDSNRSSSFQNYQKSVYGSNGWTSGTAGTDYGDSCLLVKYTMEINKSVTQVTTNGGSEQKKTTYSVDDGQRIADYQLIGASNIGTKNLGISGSPLLTTTVTIEDTLPKGLSYIDGSSYYGGTYQQAAEGRQGSVSGGTAIAPVVTQNSDGTTTLKYTLDGVKLNMNEKTVLPPIYYSCRIGDTVDILNDVEDKQKLVNEAKIWSNEDCLRPFSSPNRNLTTYEIDVSKLIQGNISKLADQVYVEKGADMGFTMAIGNNGASERQIVALDVLPYHDINGTQFANGTSCLSRVTELTLRKNTSGVDLNKLQVYYSTYSDVRAKTSNDYRNLTEEELISRGWVKLTLDTDTGKLTLPGEVIEPTGILVVGDLGAAQTLGIHMTMQLTNATPQDKAVNRLYESGGGESAVLLQAEAKTYVVGRTIEGLTWMDDNMNGVQDETETCRISGVKVSLWKLKDSGNANNEADYVAYCYPGTTSQIVIETGKQISVMAADGSAATDYALGRYKFTDLPAGTFAVKFEDGESKQISPFIAAAPNQGSDDTRDSDGIATYSEETLDLMQTFISGIKLPDASGSNAALYESKYHDSGFYERGGELPATGGCGTTVLYIFSAIIMLISGTLIYNRLLKRQKEGGRKRS